MTKKIFLAVLVAAVMPVFSARAESLAEASASAQSAARGSRTTASRAAIVAAISRVVEVYNGQGGAGNAYPLRCLGERYFPIFHRDVATLAIAALRLEQGKYPGAAGLKAVKEEIEFPASELLGFGRSKCMSFPDERARATWNGALEELGRLD